MAADGLRDAEEGRAANGPPREESPQAQPNPSDAKKGLHLYNVLGLQKNATDEEIKKWVFSIAWKHQHISAYRTSSPRRRISFCSFKM